MESVRYVKLAIDKGVGVVVRTIISLFFFSSRRRHTRLQGDWSSDVCSSDLSGNAPRVRSRRLNSFTALSRSAAVKSGQRFCRNTNSAKAHSHKRKSESRCSPPVRINKSTSVEPPRWTSASTVLKDWGESSVTL